MFDEDVIRKILSDTALSQTRGEIENLLHTELHKPDDEMDTDLIQECVLTLAEMDNTMDKPLPQMKPPVPVKTGKRKKGRRYRCLHYGLMAAGIGVLMLIAASAAKQYVQSNIPDVTVYSDSAVIHYDLIEDMELMACKGYEPSQTLESHGMRNILLPTALDAFKITHMADESTEDIRKICVNMQKDQQNYRYMCISR